MNRFILSTFICSISLSLLAHEPMQINRGYLFVIEGIDGSGKTTILKLVSEKLSTLNIKVKTTREPGATELGKTLRSLLMNQTVPTCTLAECLLFAADRAQHFHELVMPALAENYIVLSDRMADSALVYQGFVKGLDQSMIATINNWAMQERQPNLVFYLRIDVATALERINARNETQVAFEQEILEKKQLLVDGFDQVLANRANVITFDAASDKLEGKRIIPIDTTYTAEDLADIIVDGIISYIEGFEEGLQEHDVQ